VSEGNGAYLWIQVVVIAKPPASIYETPDGRIWDNNAFSKGYALHEERCC